MGDDLVFDDDEGDEVWSLESRVATAPLDSDSAYAFRKYVLCQSTDGVYLLLFFTASNQCLVRGLQFHSPGWTLAGLRQKKEVKGALRAEEVDVVSAYSSEQGKGFQDRTHFWYKQQTA
jgi:hypothetical protein